MGLLCNDIVDFPLAQSHRAKFGPVTDCLPAVRVILNHEVLCIEIVSRRHDRLGCIIGMQRLDRIQVMPENALK
jgi:hypothetical protein